jgi:hypothetical protein
MVKVFFHLAFYFNNVILRGMPRPLTGTKFHVNGLGSRVLDLKIHLRYGGEGTGR